LNNGKTLEMTGKGNYLERHSKNSDWIEIGPAWKKRSRTFAKRASDQGGDVHVFVDAARGPSPTSVWKETEERILTKNPKVRIVIHAI
jgi:hypothetical protein